MARTHSRPCSPGPTTNKRLKTSHTSSSSSTTTTNETGTLGAFANDVLDPSNVAQLHKSYLESEPFRYAVVPKLFQDDLLKKVKDECLSELSFTEKETDIYKVNQTGDLASLSYLTPTQLTLLPSLLTLRDALYSSSFRSFLRSVTGCGPLSGIKQDMSVNSYTQGCHLLNHDDVIGTRRVSYILYMPLPHYQLWQPSWGGALELYPTVDGPEGIPEPACVPSKSLPPSWNQFVFFEVQPGKSFHSVEEVVVGSGGEDGRERLSISGWFHAAQPGEEGYEPETESSPQVKSSRDQLASTQTDFKSYPTTTSSSSSSPSSPSTPPTDIPLSSPTTPLSPSHISFLSEFLNPAYLQPRTISALAARFVEESSLELHAFLNADLARALKPGLRERDREDGLGKERGGRVPGHWCGVDKPGEGGEDVVCENTNTNVGVTVGGGGEDEVTTIQLGEALGMGTGTGSGIPLPLPPGHPAINLASALPQKEREKEKEKEPSAWMLKGPPHKHRYCVLKPTDEANLTTSTPRPPSDPTSSSLIPSTLHPTNTSTSTPAPQNQKPNPKPKPKPKSKAFHITPLSYAPPTYILRSLQDDLFPSPAFRSWLALVSSLVPLRYTVEARRFRPGLDYMLARSEEGEARLDVCLGLTPEGGEGDGEGDGEGTSGENGTKEKETGTGTGTGTAKTTRGKGSNSKDKEKNQKGENTTTNTNTTGTHNGNANGNGWSTAEWGGWECYMAPHDEEDDPAVYRAGSGRKRTRTREGEGRKRAGEGRKREGEGGKRDYANGNGKSAASNGKAHANGNGTITKTNDKGKGKTNENGKTNGKGKTNGHSHSHSRARAHDHDDDHSEMETEMKMETGMEMDLDADALDALAGLEGMQGVQVQVGEVVVPEDQLSDGDFDEEEGEDDAMSQDASSDIEEEEEEEEEEESTLLTLPPSYNSLLLVLRDERVMRFVKYVSAAAEGSRWDVCGEFEVGRLEEEEEEEEEGDDEGGDGEEGM